MTYPFKPGYLVFLVAVAAFAQPAPRLEFEVASIKPAAPLTLSGGRGMLMRVGMRVDAGRMEYNNGTLRDFLRTAYRVKDYQISGPDSLSDTRYDIVAKIPDGVGTDQVPEMLQALLADRFKVTLHHETRDHAVYALIPGKNGPKLKPSDPDDQNPTAPGPSEGLKAEGVKVEGKSLGTLMLGGGAAVPVGGGAPGTGPRTTMAFRTGGGSMKMSAKKLTLANFADMVSRYVDRPVLDMTGIQGLYDFELELAPEEMMRLKGIAGAIVAVKAAGGGGDVGGGGPADAASESTGATIFQAVQQYGLKLDPRKAPVDLLVIDRAEKAPTEN